MIRSMTGFGLSKSLKKDSEVSIEIKGVNHKFLEVSIKPNENSSISIPDSTTSSINFSTLEEAASLIELRSSK